jgi:integrase
MLMGLRQGECHGLRWQDIDLDEGHVRIRNSLSRVAVAHLCGGTCGILGGTTPRGKTSWPHRGCPPTAFAGPWIRSTPPSLERQRTVANLSELRRKLRLASDS